MMISRKEFIKAAREELGTPFHHQGRNPGVALDCLGLIAVTAINRLGLPVKDYVKYRRRPNGTLLPRLRKTCIEIGIDEMQEADIYVFTHPRYKEPWHIGLRTWYQGTIGLLHACILNKKVIEQRLDTYPHGKLTHAFRIPGVG